MGVSELERLVSTAESDPGLQRTLRRCRSRQQLIHTARRLGYRITQADLQSAWLEDRQQRQAGAEWTGATAVGAGI